MSKKKCPICDAEMKIDTSAVCTSIPPKYRCVCPSCNCLDFIETSEYDQYKEEPFLSSNLDEAAEEYGRNTFINECMDNGVCDDHDLSDAFIAGAKWQAGQNDKDLSEKIAAAYQLGLANKEEQIVKEAVEGEARVGHPFSKPFIEVDLERSSAQWYNMMKKFMNGDKVRIIIVKEDK